MTLLNDKAAAINTEILTFVPGNYTEYISKNIIMEHEDATNYQVELLKSLSTPRFSAHKINKKKAVPITLLRNLSLPKLCNGTNLRVTNLQRNVIEDDILTGCGAGDSVFITWNFLFQTIFR